MGLGNWFYFFPFLLGKKKKNSPSFCPISVSRKMNLRITGSPAAPFPSQSAGSCLPSLAVASASLHVYSGPWCYTQKKCIFPPVSSLNKEGKATGRHILAFRSYKHTLILKHVGSDMFLPSSCLRFISLLPKAA